MAAGDINLRISHMPEETSSKNEARISKLKGIVTLKTLIDQQEKYYLSTWNKIFLFGCVVAVMLDPLFFYIPLINSKSKCLAMDKRLRNVALVMRTVMDITYVLHIIFQIRSGIVAEAYKASDRNFEGTSNMNKFVKHTLGVIKRIWWYILIDILAVLPIPQVVILVFFLKLRITRSSDNRKSLNVLILFQYLPRIYRIYLSSNEYTSNLDANDVSGTAWAKGLFNLFLYVIASHVAGAFWYLFAIERETSCWQYACENHQSGCNLSKTFHCDDFKVDQATVNFLNESCPVNPPNSTLFDFGIFTSVLQSGIGGSADFSRKFFYSIGWGLRNLSSFGSNLLPSTDRWENLFADSITITGLILFIYLLGNMQTYLQLSAVKSEERNNKMKSKQLDIDLWIKNNDIPWHMKMEIMQYARLKLNENRDVDLKNILSVLPLDSKRHLKHHLCFAILKKVPELQKLDDKLLHEIFINNVKAVIFEQHSYIIHENEPIDQMLFFTQGTVLSYKINKDEGCVDSRSSIEELEKGDFYGDELLQWAFSFKPLSYLPKSRKTLKTHIKVEAFALMARDLSNLVHNNRRHFRIIEPNLPYPNSRTGSASKLLAALGRAP